MLSCCHADLVYNNSLGAGLAEFEVESFPEVRADGLLYMLGLVACVVRLLKRRLTLEPHFVHTCVCLFLTVYSFNTVPCKGYRIARVGSSKQSL